MPAPLIAPVNGRRTSGFGPRNTGILGATTNHLGIDIGGEPRGSKPDVLAPQAGRIVEVHRRVTNPRGKYVRIQGEDATFLVQHLDKIPLGIVKGRRVKIGKKLGVMGSTSTVNIALHLHFEVHVNGVPVDPEKFYPAHGQPTPWERPGEGVTMRPKSRSRHLRLVIWKPDLKKAHKVVTRAHRFTKVRSRWGNWTIMRNGSAVATSRITKA